MGDMLQAMIRELEDSNAGSYKAAERIEVAKIE